MSKTGISDNRLSILRHCSNSEIFKNTSCTSPVNMKLAIALLFAMVALTTSRPTNSDTEKSSVDFLKDEFIRLEKTIKDVQEKIEKLEEEETHQGPITQITLKTLKTFLGFIEQRLEKVEARLDDLGVDVEELEGEVEGEVDVEIDGENVDINRQKRQSDVDDSTVEFLKNEAIRLEKTIKDVQEKIQKLEEDETHQGFFTQLTLKTLKTFLGFTEQQLEKVEQRLADLGVDVDELEQEAESEVSNVESEVESEVEGSQVSEAGQELLREKRDMHKEKSKSKSKPKKDKSKSKHKEKSKSKSKH